MPISVANPYSGQEDQTCSVSFAAQQKVAAGTGSPQTEAQYHKSKLLGEWGVLKAKIDKGEIPNGTKVLTYESDKDADLRAYLYIKDGQIFHKVYIDKDLAQDKLAFEGKAESVIKSDTWKVSIPKTVAPAASPTPSSAVNAGSPSKGSMSDEDVAVLYVKVKDKMAKEAGVNVQGANPALDALVYKAIGEEAGYTAAEAKGKVDAYKATGKKLSALKKKVLKNDKNTNDPKPNGVPTKATTTTVTAATQEVKEEVQAAPTKVYSDEDIAAAYIIAKDKIVAGSGGKWTLYTKSDQMDSLIYQAIQDKTGYNTVQSKTAIATYLASGKKLSQLKKSLAKQGAFEPKADTLKKTKAESDKEADIAAKAASGYTPTSTPATGKPPTDTGKPAPKAQVKTEAENGDISGIPDKVKADAYAVFKSTGALSYMTSSPTQNYQGVLKAVSGFSSQQELTPLQMLRIIDEQGAKKFGVENTNVFEKKVVTWLTTPEAKKWLEDQKEELAKQAAKAKEQAEIAEAAKKLAASQPPLPADSALFDAISVEKAKKLLEESQASRPWTATEKRDLKHYTGGSYRQMNGYLRGDTNSIDTRNEQAIKGAKAGMRPSTEAFLVHRGTGLSQFGLKDENLIWGITGKTFQDNGFLSTSVGGRAAFGGKILMEIEAPIGTPMAFVKPISNYPNENEMLLAPGLKYKVLRVDVEESTWGGKKYIVRLRVVND